MVAIKRFFKLEEMGTTVGTEVRAGVVTFMTMAYIIVVQPIVLKEAGMPVGGVMLATCLSSAIATLMIALLANYPVAMAPCMGHNFYFAWLVTSGVVPSWREALGAIFISGSLFIVLSLFGFRERIMHAVPDSLKYAIAVGIGLLIALVGLETAGIVATNADNPIATGLKVGHFGKPTLLAVLGLGMSGALLAFRVRGAILLGLVATTGIGILMGLVTPVASPVSAPPWSELRQTAFGLDILGALKLGFVGVIFTFFFLDLFDAIGTLIAVAQQANLMVDGKLPRAREALLSDAAGTVVGAVLGTSTVSSYIESTAGVSEGGRTGLASVVTALLFVAAIFFSPCVYMIAGGVLTEEKFEFKSVNASWTPDRAAKEPARTLEVAASEPGKLRVRRIKVLSPVTAPTLILIGCLIMTAVTQIPWKEWTEALPAFLAILMMPLTGNITEGIAFGFIAHTFLKLVTGRVREVSPWVAVFAVLFVVRYIWLG